LLFSAARLRSPRRGLWDEARQTSIAD